MADQIIDGVIVPEATINALRLMIGSSDLTDQQLAVVLVETRDDTGEFNLDRAAASIWRGKAAQYAELVNVSESGSSRSLGDLHKNALAMANMYDAKLAEIVLAGSRRSRTRAIVRPTA